jgi:hypothetical protein
MSVKCLCQEERQTMPALGLGDRNRTPKDFT